MRKERERWVAQAAQMTGIPVGTMVDKMWEDEEADEEDEKLKRRKRMGGKGIGSSSSSDSDSDLEELSGKDGLDFAAYDVSFFNHFLYKV